MCPHEVRAPLTTMIRPATRPPTRVQRQSTSQCQCLSHRLSGPLAHTHAPRTPHVPLLTCTRSSEAAEIASKDPVEEPVMTTHNHVRQLHASSRPSVRVPCIIYRSYEPPRREVGDPQSHDHRGGCQCECRYTDIRHCDLRCEYWRSTMTMLVFIQTTTRIRYTAASSPHRLRAVSASAGAMPSRQCRIQDQSRSQCQCAAQPTHRVAAPPRVRGRH